MKIFKNTDLIFKSFGQDYSSCDTYRYKLADDSVILICGLTSYYGLLFDVYYSYVPVFSHFNLKKRYLDDATGFNARIELKNIPCDYLFINPQSEGDEIIEKASELTEYAHEKLERVKNLDDCLSIYEQRYAAVLSRGICSSPSRFHLDILIARREFEKCKTLLDKALLNNVHWAFNYSGVPFPEDGDWRTFLPESMEDANNSLETELFAVERSCWKSIRVQLEEGRYYELCSELMDLYQVNKKLLKKVGINVNDKVDAMMDEMMREVEVYR